MENFPRDVFMLEILCFIRGETMTAYEAAILEAERLQDLLDEVDEESEDYQDMREVREELDALRAYIWECDGKR